MTGRVTITDVARTAGVSVATVSKVINGRYGVAATTSARVQGVIAELGYETSLVARSLRSRSTNVIGILVAEFEPYSTEILKGASKAMGGSGYDLLAYAGAGHGGGEVGWESRSLSRLSGTLIDGAILVTPTVVDVRDGVPLVAIDPHRGPSGHATVDAENSGGAMLATEYLIDLGHRRIAFLGGREDLESSRLREEGFRAAMAAAGLEVDPRYLRVGGYKRETADQPAHELLALPDRPTAVFAANDLMAIATIDAAADMGLRVPEDLSVVGFDDVPEAGYLIPSLTTVRPDFDAVAKEALDLLLAQVGGHDVGDPQRTIAPTLVPRDSVRPPSGRDQAGAPSPRSRSQASCTAGLEP